MSAAAAFIAEAAIAAAVVALFRIEVASCRISCCFCCCWCAASVDPHLPESRVLRLPTKNLVKGMENNSLTYLVAGGVKLFSV